MKKNNEINIYWSPAVTPMQDDPEDWNMLYRKPYFLFDDLLKYRYTEKNKLFGDSYFACPAVNSKMKNTIVFTNSLSCGYKFFKNNDGSTEIVPLSKNYYRADILRPPSVDFGPLIKFSLQYIFFSDSDVEINLTSPTFNKPGYYKYGSIVPGRFNIGSWFRPINFELQMWENNGEIFLEEDEPLFYIDVLSDKKVNLKRFEYNEKLFRYSKHCVTSPFVFGQKKSLAERYKTFRMSNMRELILKEINNNIVEDIR